MKKTVSLIIILFILLLSACTNKEVEEEIELPGNDISSFNQTEGQKIPVLTVAAPYSDISGQIDAFSKYQKPADDFFVTFHRSLIKTHQFIFTFDAIYPIDKIHFNNGNLEKVSIDYALDEKTFKRYRANYHLDEGENTIELEGLTANAIRFVFESDSSQTVKDIYFTLAMGFIVKKRADWFDAFYQYDGWSGADGIFSFNLDGSVWGGDSKKAFIFSDTLIGEVYPHNNVRKNTIMIFIMRSKLEK